MNFDLIGLEEKLKRAVCKYHIPGLSIAIEQDGRKIFSLGLGFANITKNLATTPHTIFGTASLTKILTTLILLKAEELELVKLSDKLSVYYPDLERLDISNASIKNLLNHSAGLPGLPTRHIASDLNNPRINPEFLCIDSLIKFLNEFKFDVLEQPGQLLSYSNEGYCLLGGIIERIFGETFETVAKKLVFKPLKMKNSFIGRDKSGRFKDIAEPMISWKKDIKASQTEYWDAPLFYPAGGLMSSANDIVKLSSALYGASNFLKCAQYKQVTFDPMPVASRNERFFAYGLGTEIEYINNKKTLLWHTGQRPGISSFVGQVIPDRLSVALLTNISDAPASKIGRLVLSHFYSRDDKPKKLKWLQTTDNLSIHERDLKNFVGIYGSAEVGEYHIHLEGKILLMKFVSSKNEMLFNEANSGIVGSQTFKFMFTSRAEPYALALDLRILPRLA